MKKKKEREAEQRDKLRESTLTWEPLPYCGECLALAEAQQPGGLNARHMDGTPLCRPGGKK